MKNNAVFTAAVKRPPAIARILAQDFRNAGFFCLNGARYGWTNQEICRRFQSLRGFYRLLRSARAEDAPEKLCAFYRRFEKARAEMKTKRQQQKKQRIGRAVAVAARKRRQMGNARSTSRFTDEVKETLFEAAGVEQSPMDIAKKADIGLSTLSNWL